MLVPLNAWTKETSVKAIPFLLPLELELDAATEEVAGAAALVETGATAVEDVVAGAGAAEVLRVEEAAGIAFARF
jgi:hypothetical protein